MNFVYHVFLFIKWVIKFTHFYAKEIFISNFRVAKLVLSRNPRFHDKIAEFRAPVSSSLQMVLLMNLVTMTPGTISLDFEESPSLLRVHFLFDDEVKDFQRKLDEYYLPFLQAVIPC